LGPSDNEKAQAQQLEAMMNEHRGDLSSGVPRSRGTKPRRPQAAPRPSASVQKQGRAKADSYELMSRRRKVQGLRLRGLSYQEIAHELSITDEQAKSDLEYLRKASRDAIDHFQQVQQQGDALATYEELEAKAWEEYESAVDDEGHPMTTARLKCLDLIRTIRNDRLRALQDCGLLTKVAEKVEHKVAYQLPWDHKLKQAAAQAMLASVLTPQLPAPEPDIIDIIEVAPPEAEVVQQIHGKKDESSEK